MIDQLNKLTDEEVRVRVATSVGWTHVEKRWGNGEKILTGLPPGKELSYGFHRVPVFARDLNAAFTLVEKLKGDDWKVHIYRNPPDKWRIDLKRYAEDQWPFIEHPSLARAICLSLLAVTEREEG